MLHLSCLVLRVALSGYTCSLLKLVALAEGYFYATVNLRLSEVFIYWLYNSLCSALNALLSNRLQITAFHLTIKLPVCNSSIPCASISAFISALNASACLSNSFCCASISFSHLIRFSIARFPIMILLSIRLCIVVSD